ncbi:unnamed protein product [Closterium sp. NIES-53]
MAAQELRWLTYLLTDLGEPPRSPPVLYVDNKAMLALCREHRLEHRTKHIALRYFLARELQQRGQLRLAYVASQANTADIFTKALQPCDHQRFCTMLACFALLCLTGLVTPSSPPLCLWGCPPEPFPVSSLASLLTHPGGSSTTPHHVVFCPLRTSRTPPVDPLPPQGPAPSGVSQVDPAEPVEVAVDSGAARGAEPAGAGTGGAGTGGAEPERAEPGGAEPERVEFGGAEPERVEPGGTLSWGAEPTRAESGGSPGVPLRREPLSQQRLREWYASRCRRATGATGGAAGAGATGGAAGAGATGSAGGAAGGAGGAVGAGAARGAAGAGAAGGAGCPGAVGGPGGARIGGTGAAGSGGAAGVVAGDPGTEGTSAISAVSGGAERPRPYYVPLLQQVLGLPPSPVPTPPFLSPPPLQSQLQLQLASPLRGPSPYSRPTRGLTECREPASRPVSPESRPVSPESCSASPVRTFRAGHVSRPRPPPVLGTHSMNLSPSTAPQRVPLPSSPASSLLDGLDPEPDSLRAARLAVTRFPATALTDPLFESTAVSALACFAASVPHLVSMLLAPEGDPDAPNIPTPRSYADAIEGPYSSQWQAAMDAEMDSWKSTGTYVDEVPPHGANIISDLWILRVKRPQGSPPVFKARYVARGFSQRQGVDFFHTFSPTPKMTTLRVLLHVAAQRDYELHSLDFSTAFLQGSLQEEIWLRRPPGFTGSFPAGTNCSCEAEIYAGAMAAQELRWLTYLLTDLGEQPRSPPVLLCGDFVIHPELALPFFTSLFGGGAESLKLLGFVDAADAGEKQNQTSTDCYVFVFGVAAVSWSSQRIKCATLSSTESEYVAATEAGKEGRRLCFLLAEFWQLDAGTPTVLRVDNKSAITVAEGMGLTGNLKHMERRQAWLQHMVKRGKFLLRNIPAAEQPADFLTKALHYPAFNRCSVAIDQVRLVDMGDGDNDVQ